MVKLYIHIGTHKTASTTIQTALYNNRGYLENEGIVVLSPPISFRTLMSSTTLNVDLSKDNLSLVNQVKQYPKNADLNFLVSFEGLSGDPILGYKNSKIIAKILREMTLEFEVKIIIYLRRQDHFIESLYTQKIHEGESYSFHEFINKFDEFSFNWESLLDSYDNEFGKENLIVRKYDTENLPKSNSILRDFGTIIGSKYMQMIDNNESRNLGYSRDALEVARLTNPYLNESDKKRLRHILQKTNTKQPFDSYSFFSELEREHFLSQYIRSNSNVAKKYFYGSSEGLFPESNPSIENGQYQGLTLENAVVVLTKAMLSTKEVQNENSSLIIRNIIKTESRLLKIISKYPNLKKVVKEIWRQR